MNYFLTGVCVLYFSFLFKEEVSGGIICSQTNFNLSIPDSCNSYRSCKSGVLRVEWCPDSVTFDSETNMCSVDTNRRCREKRRAAARYRLRRPSSKHSSQRTYLHENSMPRTVRREYSATSRGITNTIELSFDGKTFYHFEILGPLPKAAEGNGLAKWAANNYKKYVRHVSLSGKNMAFKDTPRGQIFSARDREGYVMNENSISAARSYADMLQNRHLPKVTSKMPKKCGKRVPADDRIHHGTTAEMDKNPWQVAIIYRGNSSVICGGSIITSFHIVSAAHCFVDKNGFPNTFEDDFYVVAGSSVVNSHITSDKLLSARKVYLLPNYRITPNSINDIAVIVLEYPLNFTSFISPICLPPAYIEPPSKLSVIISGWGSTEYAVQTEHLQEAEIKLIERDVCHNVYEKKEKIITKGMLCAGDIEHGGADTCQGDSGGPLAGKIKGDSRYYLLGVTSWGKGCGLKGYPGVYTKVSEYVPWIINTINDSTKEPLDEPINFDEVESSEIATYNLD